VPPFNGDCFLKGLFGLVIASSITVGRVWLPYNSLTEDHADSAEVLRRIVLRRLPTDMSFDSFLRQPKHEGKIRHVVVVRDDRVVGVLRVNTGIRRGLESAYTGVTLDDVASREFIIAHEEDIMFGVIGHMWRRGAMMVVVVRGNGEALASNVLGVITKEHVADSVALSVRPYASVDGRS
jgi:predicted transcriptional regulator